MKLKTKTMLFTIALIAPFIIATHASASGAGYQYSASANRKVITTKDVKLYRVTVGKDEADNKFKLLGTLKTGTYLKVSNWIMSTGGGYVVKSKSFYPDANHFYFVFASKNSDWNEKYTVQRMDNIKLKNSNAKLHNIKQKIKQQNKEAEKEKQADILPQGQYQTTSDQNALNAVDYHIVDGEYIREKYDPTDKRAVVPSGYQPKDNDEWDSYSNNWIYLDQKDATSNGYDNAGWMKD